MNEVRILPASGLDQPIRNPDNRFLATDPTFENVSKSLVFISSLLEFVLNNEKGYSSHTANAQQRELAEGEIALGQRASREGPAAKGQPRRAGARQAPRSSDS